MRHDEKSRRSREQSGETSDSSEQSAAPAQETRAFFQMYGSKRDQTWHGQHARSGELVNPLPLTFANEDRKD